MTPSVIYDLTIEDMRAFRNRPYPGRPPAIFRRSWWTVVLFGLGGAFAAATLWLQLQRRHPDIGEATLAAFFAGGGLTAALVLALGAYERRRGLHKADAKLVAQGPFEVCADDARLEVRQAGLSIGYPWTAFTAIEETPGHVFLHTGPERAVVVPRTAVAGTAAPTIAPADVPRVRSACRRSMPSAKIPATIPACHARPTGPPPPRTKARPLAPDIMLCILAPSQRHDRTSAPGRASLERRYWE